MAGNDSMWHNDPPATRLDGSLSAAMPARDVQHVWYEMTRHQSWRSVALVPVGAVQALTALGHDLARMAALDPRHRVLLINATGTADGVSRATPPARPGEPVGPVACGKYALLDCTRLNLDDAAIGMVEVPRYLEQARLPNGAYNLIIVATHAPLSRPAAVSAARSCDGVALCVSLGHTDFASTQRTLELVGETRVLGAIALR